jgi:hypothetical protein
VVCTQTPSQVIGAEQGRGELMTIVASLNGTGVGSLRKVVSLSGQFHANYILLIFYKNYYIIYIELKDKQH